MLGLRYGYFTVMLRLFYGFDNSAQFKVVSIFCVVITRKGKGDFEFILRWFTIILR